MSNVKNLQAFGKLKGVCTRSGGYKPGQPNLQEDALNSLENNATQVLMDASVAQTTYDNITNKREQDFKGIRHLSSRIVSMLIACGASPLTIKDAQASTRKLWGRKAKHPAVAKAAQQENVADQPQKAELTRGRDYATMAFHFQRLVDTISADPKYIAIEPELSVTGLKAKAAEMHYLNGAVTQAQVDLFGMRMKRNAVFYHDENSLYATAVAIKYYVRGAFGFSSEQRAEVSKIRFTKPRK